MKILFISMELPYPDKSGGSKYAWQKIKQLAKENEIYLVSFNEKNETIDKKEYEKYVKEYYFFPRKKNWAKIILQIFKPYSLTSRVSVEMKRTIKKLLNDKKIDLILIDSIHMYYNIEDINKKMPIYLTQQNIEYKLFETISKTSTSKIKKMIYKIEALKLRKIEKNLYKKNIFDGYIFISNEDMKNYFKEIGKVNATCIYPSIDLRKKVEKDIVQENIIVFSAKMSYEPNITAVHWFVNEIFPIILKEIPDAKFYIVGKDPTEDIKNLNNNKNIIVTGMVDNVQEYLLKAKIVVIPLLSGGGIKLKLFDALETKNIVITTSKGVEGTCFENMRDLFIEDEPIKFAKRCIENLKNPNLDIANNGYKTLCENYDFNIIQNKLQNFINN